MSQVYDPNLEPEPDPEPETPEETQLSEEDFKQMRAAANRTRKAEREAQSAQRELAFVRAGIDTETPMGQMFYTAYQGELTPEAIKAAHAELTGEQAPTPQQTEEQQQQAAQSRERQDLAAGAQPDTGVQPPEPVIGRDGKHVKDALAAIAAGETREDAQGGFFRARASSAMEGDGSVIVEGIEKEGVE